MDPIDRLTRIDLNLLVSLYVLLDERNVTRAAERLFITQPAASRTLTRLRELFDDPLLSRSGSEMVMTPRAQLLKEQLPNTLEAVGTLVAPVDFDPATHEQNFRVAIPEIFAQSLISRLLGELADQAPGISIGFRDPDDTAHRALLTGDVDFLVRQSRRDTLVKPPLHAEPLLDFHPVIVARPTHSLARKKTLALAQLLEYTWIDCYPSDAAMPMSPFDIMLEQRGLSRTVVFRSTHLLSALEAVRESDCLLFLAHAGHRNSVLASNCRMLTLKDPLFQQAYRLELLQHRRTLSSDAHAWIKEKLQRLIQAG